MALSGSRNWIQTCEEITERAMDLTGTLNQGPQTLNAEKLQNRELLNMVVQAISARDILSLWRRIRRTDLYISDVLQNITTSGTSTYDLGTDVLDVYPGSIWVRPSGGTDQKIIIMSDQQYAEEGTKDQAGRPTRVLIEKNQAYTDSKAIQGRLRYVFHPVPDNSTDVIGYTCITKLDDFDSQNDDPDAPPVWMRALVYGLAVELSVKYGLALARTRYFRSEFEAELEHVRRHDSPRGGMRFTPIFPGGW